MLCPNITYCTILLNQARVVVIDTKLSPRRLVADSPDTEQLSHCGSQALTRKQYSPLRSTARGAYGLAEPSCGGICRRVFESGEVLRHEPRAYRCRRRAVGKIKALREGTLFLGRDGRHACALQVKLLFVSPRAGGRAPRNRRRTPIGCGLPRCGHRAKSFGDRQQNHFQEDLYYGLTSLVELRHFRNTQRGRPRSFLNTFVGGACASGVTHPDPSPGAVRNC